MGNIKRKMEKKIFAVIDAQGYSYDKVFYPREFSFVTKDVKLLYEVVPNISFSEKENHKRTFSFQKENIHAIPMERVMNVKHKRTIDETQLIDLITYLFDKYKVNQESVFAIKNQQFANYLLKFENFPALFDLDLNPVGDELCPSLHTFDLNVNNYFCPLHYQLPIKRQLHYRCSLRKCMAIWNWVSDKRISDEVISKIEQLKI